MSDTNPPVLKTALRHFIQHPSHAPKKPCHRPRIPKKLNGKLSLKKEVDSQEGFGLYLQERICWSRVFVIEGIFATCCLIFAVVWCITHNGGIQDGFVDCWYWDCVLDHFGGCFASSVATELGLPTPCVKNTLVTCRVAISIPP